MEEGYQGNARRRKAEGNKKKQKADKDKRKLRNSKEELLRPTEDGLPMTKSHTKVG